MINNLIGTNLTLPVLSLCFSCSQTMNRSAWLRLLSCSHRDSFCVYISTAVSETTPHPLYSALNVSHSSLRNAVSIPWSLTGARYPIMQRFASAAGWEWVKVWVFFPVNPLDDRREINSWVVEQYNSQKASLFHFYFITHFKTRRFKWLPAFIVKETNSI